MTDTPETVEHKETTTIPDPDDDDKQTVVERSVRETDATPGDGDRDD